MSNEQAKIIEPRPFQTQVAAELEGLSGAVLARALRGEL
jgi:hypothetical protein